MWTRLPNASYPSVVEVSPPEPTVYIQQPQYVQPQYVQPQYARPQYAQPQYAQPQYAQQAEQPAAASDAASWWYYCNESRTYYPYVKECASPWQRVAPTPAPSAPR